MKLPLMIIVLAIPSPILSISDAGHFFNNEYQKTVSGKWGSVESLSGPGSTLEQTKIIRSSLPVILERLAIQSIIDAPCGDFNWMQHVDFKDCDYIGIDVVKDLIERNNALYHTINRSFICADLILTAIPYADLIISRDFLVHLSNKDATAALRNLKKSGAKYLLTTTFSTRENYNITSGGWRPINLQKPPFNFPDPIAVIVEGCTEQDGAYADKSLGLWKLSDINL